MAARRTGGDKTLAFMKQIVRGASGGRPPTVNLRAFTTRRGLRPVDVVAIRFATGLSQQRFARACGLSVHTLRNWEQGRRVPHGPGRALLIAIARSPVAVMKALKP
jgi:putative transcriptional regulator